MTLKGYSCCAASLLLDCAASPMFFCCLIGSFAFRLFCWETTVSFSVLHVRTHTVLQMQHPLPQPLVTCHIFQQSSCWDAIMRDGIGFWPQVVAERAQLYLNSCGFQPWPIKHSVSLPIKMKWKWKKNVMSKVKGAPLLFLFSAGLCLKSQAFVASLMSWKKACMEAQRTGGQCSTELAQQCLSCW